ncbi:MAG: ABC transporter ATP-binding protein [Nitrospiraceae bacterium]|nr:MAG: ABC transporter ATP-binding protein [Nitrospiraceae bacterium]UCH45252.1 MAG: ABC transporter ATP-binding protein [Nitrospiraceae bacterium]
MIVIDHLVKQYGDHIAVNDISLEIKAGEIFGFLGPNGAGKTSTIKMIMGLSRPTSGSITIDGHDIQKDPGSAKKVLGYIPDRPIIYEKLTAWEYMKFIAGLYGIDDRECKERGNKYLEIFELAEWSHELVGNFSHGMKQRLNLSAVFMRNPKVLILDEPLVGLDPRGARLLKEMLLTSRNNGMCIFMSTHILEIADQMCDRMAIIVKGNIISVGTADELKQQAHAPESGLEQIFLRLTGGEDVEGIVQELKE